MATVLALAWLGAVPLATTWAAEKNVTAGKNVAAGKKPAEPPKLTGARRQVAEGLLNKFKRPRSTPQDRQQAVSKALELGPQATLLLKTAIEKELQAGLKNYRTEVQKRAEQLYRTKAAELNMADIEALRAKVLALKERPDLTKEMITTEADPAVAQLRDLLIIDRDTVMNDRKLQELRARLLEVGLHWQRCQTALASADPTTTVPNFESYLAGEEELAILHGMPMDAQTKQTFASNAALSKQLDPEEARAIAACNFTRCLLGLPVLAIDLKLCEAARDHSQDMTKLNFFSHQSPVEGKASPWDRAKNFGTTASGENIFMGSNDGLRANEGWFHSPGHHKNMLGRHARIGVGHAGKYFTEMFGG